MGDLLLVYPICNFTIEPISWRYDCDLRIGVEEVQDSACGDLQILEKH